MLFVSIENSEKQPTPAASPDNCVENGMRRKVEIEFALKYSELKFTVKIERFSSEDIN